MIPYGHQNIDAADINAVIETLTSDFLTQGPRVDAFEAAVMAACGARYGIAVNSATSALHVACMALDVGPGDTVWTSPNSFVASANCAVYCGAAVDFVDIDPLNGNISIPALREKLAKARIEGCLPKVVIPVHFCGEPCDLQAIRDLADEYGFRIIEDASHAIGATFGVTKIGDCAFSDITVFSFHPVKIVTTAEGGMMMTNDAGLAAKMQRLRSHGITRDSGLMDKETEGPWYYQQIELGYNYRLTDLQAALGLSQMQRLEAFVEARQALAKRYDELLCDVPVTALERNRHGRSALHLYVIRLDPSLAGAGRRRVFEAMRAAGIGVNVHYIPIHTQPFYRARGFVIGQFPQAEEYYATALTLPLFPDLTEGQQEQVVGALKAAIV